MGPPEKFPKFFWGNAMTGPPLENNNYGNYNRPNQKIKRTFRRRFD